MTHQLITTNAGVTACKITDGYKIVTIFHNNDGTMYHCKNHAKGKEIEGDAEIFLDYYAVLLKRECDKIESERKKSEEIENVRIEELKKAILFCKDMNIYEFSKQFGLTKVETANHWDDLYSGKSMNAVLMSDRMEYEIMQTAIDLLGIEGEYGECRHRAGEHHQTFYPIYGGIEAYQRACKDHFNGDKFFYRSEETETESILERIKDAESIDEVRALLNGLDEVIANEGYYDCNGNIEMLDKDLNSPDFTGYSSDVYSYSFAFQFSHKDLLVEPIDEDNE